MPTSLKNLSGPRKKKVTVSQRASKTKPAENQASKTSLESKKARLDASPAEAIIESDAVKAVAKKPAPKKTSAKAPARKKAPAKTRKSKSTKKSTTTTKKTSRKAKK